MSTWSLEPVFGWLAVVPLAIILLSSLWLTITTVGLSPGARTVLASLRLLAMLLLLAGWLRPGLVKSTLRDSEGAIAVLLDQSQSMTLPSGTSDKTRWEVLRQTWETIQQLSGGALGKTRIVPYFFDNKLHPVSPAGQKDALQSALAKPPAGLLTDIGTALAELQAQQADPPLRAVFVLSDAAQSVLPVKTDAIQVARQMAQLDQPVVMVGIGPRGDTSQLRDIAVEGVPEQFDAFVKNVVSIPTVLRIRGMQNQPIRLSISLKASGKPRVPLVTQEIIAKQGDQLVTSKIDAPAAGEYLLEITASTDANELVKSNNTATSFLIVREGGARILYLEGEARHEVRFLKRSLNASLDFQLDDEWLNERIQRRGPIDLQRFNFELTKFDAIILGDLPASALSVASLEAIKRRVEQGAGLLLLGGYRSYEAGGYGSSPLAPLFPMEMRAVKSQKPSAPIDPTFHIPGPVPMEPTQPHEITTFAAGRENEEIWKSLKPLLGANRFGKLKPGAQILAATPKSGSKREPLLVASEAGQGRVLAFAGDSTYQWWMQGQELRHKQFWRQCMLWLLRRDSLQEGFRLVLDRRRLLLGEDAELGIEWFGGSSGKPMPEQIRIELYANDRWLRALNSNSVRENRREVNLVNLNEPGLYRVLLKSQGADGTGYETDLAFLVRDESRELSNPSADWQMMENIAAASAQAGGRVILPEDIGAAIEWFRHRQEKSRTPIVEKRRLGDQAWDAWIYLILFCAVLTCEWSLRKIWLMP